jgi:hypothetical protein
VLRSLLNIPFTQRMDRSKKGTLTVSFVVWLPICSRYPTANRRLGPLLLLALCAPQFRDTDQVEGGVAEHEQPVHLASARSFTFFRARMCFSEPARAIHREVLGRDQPSS